MYNTITLQEALLGKGEEAAAATEQKARESKRSLRKKQQQ
jgi:hypothetical protein